MVAQTMTPFQNWPDLVTPQSTGRPFFKAIVLALLVTCQSSMVDTPYDSAPPRLRWVISYYPAS